MRVQHLFLRTDLLLGKSIHGLEMRPALKFRLCHDLVFWIIRAYKCLDTAIKNDMEQLCV